MSEKEQKNRVFKWEKAVMLFPIFVIMMIYQPCLGQTTPDTVRINMKYYKKEVTDLSIFNFSIIINDSVKIEIESSEHFLLLPYESLDNKKYDSLDCNIIITTQKSKKNILEGVPYNWLKSRKWNIIIYKYKKQKSIKRTRRSYGYYFGSENLWLTN